MTGQGLPGNDGGGSTGVETITKVCCEDIKNSVSVQLS